MSEKLKPCPFCGGEAKKLFSYSRPLYRNAITCKRCEATTAYFEDEEKEEAIEAWNKRAYETD